MSARQVPSPSRYRLAALVAAVLVAPLAVLSPASPAGADPTLPIQVDGTQVTLIDGLVTVADASTFTMPFVNTGPDPLSITIASAWPVSYGPSPTLDEENALWSAGVDPATLTNSSSATLVSDTCVGSTLAPFDTCEFNVELPPDWPLDSEPFGVYFEMEDDSIGVVARTLLVWPVVPPPPPGPPANDDFVNATDLSGLTIPEWGDPPLVISGDTTGATLETGEMDYGDQGGSVWYKFTAPPGGFAGQLGVRAADTGFYVDRLMAGYPDPMNPGLLHPSNLPAQVDRLTTARGNEVVPFDAAPNTSFVRMEPGHTVYFRVSSRQYPFPGDGPFSLELFRAPVGNDPVQQAWDVWQGQPFADNTGWGGDGTTFQVTPDAPGQAPTAWFTHVFDRPGMLTIGLTSEDAKGLPSDRPLGVSLYRAPTNSPVTDVAQLGTPVASATGTLSSAWRYLDGSWVLLDQWAATLMDVAVTPGRYYIAIERGSAGGTFFAISDQFHASGPPPPPPAAQVRIGDVSVMEGDSGSRNLSFPVTLSQPAATDVTVQVDVVAGTATPGTDYVAPTRTKTLRFKPGQTTKTVNVPVLQDLDVEGDETLTVELSNPSAPYTIADGEGVGTILDDDGFASPNVGIGDVRVYEGTDGTKAGKVILPVTLSSPAVAETTVVATVYVGTADGSDLRLLTKPKRITFRAGTWKKAVSMLLYPDAVIEPDETITVVLSDPSSGLVIARSGGTGTIANDD
ncbi:Calx-beta domain-containing protein [Rhabdothermincola sp.]|uniref:Calx-beta domain-containing protein n=1 Tax=Rhabdothermincola sp. TaxID=2820405 RepID=UPI002FE0AB31